MLKSFRRRVMDSFDNNDHDDIRQYLDWLRAAIGESSTNVRRTVLGILLLVAAFELAVDSPGTRISLGSLQIYKGSIVLLFIPVIVAYLYFQITLDSDKLFILRKVYGCAFSKWSSKGHENSLESFILPTMPIYWPVDLGSERELSFPSSRMADTINGLILTFFIIFGFITFEIRAYYLLYRQHLPITLWLVCCSVSTLFFLSSLWHSKAIYADQHLFGKDGLEFREGKHPA